MTTTLLAAVTETENELPAEPWVIGVITFAVFVVLLLITQQFNRDR